MVTVRRRVAMGAMRGIYDRDAGVVAEFPDEVPLSLVHLRQTEVGGESGAVFKMIVTFTRIKSTPSS